MSTVSKDGEAASGRISNYDLTLMDELETAIEKSRKITDKLALKDHKLVPHQSGSASSSLSSAHAASSGSATTLGGVHNHNQLLPAPQVIQNNPRFGNIHRTHSDSNLHTITTSTSPHEHHNMSSSATFRAPINIPQTDNVDLLNQHIKQLLSRVYEQEVELSKYHHMTVTPPPPHTQHTHHADLVLELYEANKRRDESMLTRLSQVSEERETALTRLKAAQDKLQWYIEHHRHCNKSPPPASKQNEDSLGGSDVRDHISHVLSSTSSADIESHISAALSQYERRTRDVRSIEYEEMRSMVDDRDEARSQCERLERELSEVRSHVLALIQGAAAGVPGSGQGAAAASDTMSTTTRDICQHLDDIKTRLDESESRREESDRQLSGVRSELDRLRLYYSLHGSLSEEYRLAEQYSQHLSQVRDHVHEQVRDQVQHAADQLVHQAEADNNHVLAKLKDALRDNRVLHEQLTRAQQGQQDAQNECNRLQRLVNVLRKKVNNMGVVQQP